jgi:hypothetical protein
MDAQATIHRMLALVAAGGAKTDPPVVRRVK